MGYYSHKREVKLKTEGKKFGKGIIVSAALATFVLSILLGRFIGAKLLESHGGLKSAGTLGGYTAPNPGSPPETEVPFTPQRQNITAPPLVIPPPVVLPKTREEAAAKPNPEETQPSNSPTPAPAAAKFKVQAGIFMNEENAAELTKLLQEQGYASGVERVVRTQGEFFRVWVGPFDSRDEAETNARTLNGAGYQAFVFEAAPGTSPH